MSPNIPADLRYSKSDEWVRAEGDELVIGISDFAQDALGDIVYIELPAVGATLTPGAPFGVIESVKASSDLYAPVGGEVVVSIRPEAVDLATESSLGAVRNEWHGTVVTRAFLGDAVDHVVAVGKHELRARVNPSVSIEPGTQVYLRLDPSKISLVPVG